MLGQVNTRQSDKAKQTDIKMGLAPQAPYVENYQNFLLNTESLLCKLLPRVLTEPMVIKIKDEYGQPLPEQEVNQMGFDYSGEAKRIANDLTSARYRAVPVIGDDSRTNRESQMKEFMQLLEAIGNQLFQLDPIFLGQTFSLFPNRFAREASKFLMEYGERQMQAQQAAQQAETEVDMVKQQQRKEIEMEKLRRPKIAFKLGPKDIQEAPEGAKIMYQIMRGMEAEAEQKEQQKQIASEQEAAMEQQQQPEGME
jgi:hypothetical protein